MKADRNQAPLSPNDLELLDYLIAKAIESCIAARTLATRERTAQKDWTRIAA
ncbi:MAG: hypothetical protein ABI704_13080 [Kofleriaceae bacterium]